MTNVDAVAEAIFIADWPEDVIKESDFRHISVKSRKWYLGLAQAAIDAMQLTEEYSNAYRKEGDGGVWRDERTQPLPLGIAQANMRMQDANPWCEDMRIEERFVSPWVRLRTSEEVE